MRKVVQYRLGRKHIRGLNRHDTSGFAFKHWALCHSDLAEPPVFSFSVVKQHSDPMSRLVHEAIRIPKRASMNSRSEWGGYEIVAIHFLNKGIL